MENVKELQLKHLAPYLPYRLMVLHGDKKKVMNTGQGSSTYWIGISAVIRWQDIKAGCQPILRPLSDLTKEIEVNGGEKFVPTEVLYAKLLSLVGEVRVMHKKDVDEFGIEILSKLSKEKGYDHIKHWMYQDLIKWHFDVFSLIEYGLALDINTLKTE